MRKADEEAEIISDWKFAAMVVDRFESKSQNFLQLSFGRNRTGPRIVSHLFMALFPFLLSLYPQILSIRVYVLYNSRYSYRVAVSPSHNRSIKQDLDEMKPI